MRSRNETDGPLIALDLTRRYDDLLAVNRVSFSLRPGEVLALLGPNGAGKTTLIRMLCGLLEPDSGTMRILGASGRNLRAVRRVHVGHCPQFPVIWHDLTPLEQLAFMADMYGLKRSRGRARAMELLDRLGLSARANTLAGRLSGGMKRLLNLALCLIHAPRILLLDEPYPGLDLDSRLRVREMLLRLAHDENKSILFSTHDMDEAERLSDRAAIMHQGALLALDTPGALAAAWSGRRPAGRPPSLEDVFRALTRSNGGELREE